MTEIHWADQIRQISQQLQAFVYHKFSSKIEREDNRSQQKSNTGQTLLSREKKVDQCTV